MLRRFVYVKTEWLENNGHLAYADINRDRERERELERVRERGRQREKIDSEKASER